MTPTVTRPRRLRLLRRGPAEEPTPPPTGTDTASAHLDPQSPTATRRLLRGPVAPARGWRGPASGRVGYVDTGSVYLASTTQAAGLFPFVQAAGLPPSGVPIGRDLLTCELVCIDPPGWVGQLTNNPGVWVQAEPGVGKSAIIKRLTCGLVAFGYFGLIPADVKGEYTALVAALDGQVLKVGRGWTGSTRWTPDRSGEPCRTCPGTSATS